MIEVEALRKSYDGVAAVRGVSFHVPAGEVLGLVGPNGAGKTTTLRCVAGIIAPTAGRVRVAGIDIAAAPVEAKRRLAGDGHRRRRRRGRGRGDRRLGHPLRALRRPERRGHRAPRPAAGPPVTPAPGRCRQVL